jgi:hypothetical protein
MTTTTVDMMSEAWIDKIEAETKTPEQTFKTSKKMTVKKTTSSIVTRGLDSFLAFQSKEFISGYRESRHHPAPQQVQDTRLVRAERRP